MLSDRVRMGAQTGVYDDLTNSPGSKKLIGGDMSAGFFGEVSADDLFSGDELASAIGLTKGTPHYSDGGWLKFASEEKIIFKSRLSFRYGISWNDINSVGAVFGTTTVIKNGLTYKVRLMKTAVGDSSTGNRGKKLFNSEWNNLMYPIHINAKTDTGWVQPENVEKPTPYWNIDFTNEYLGFDLPSGGQHLTQTSWGNSKINRGSGGVSGSHSAGPVASWGILAWSPVLELIE